MLHQAFHSVVKLVFKKNPTLWDLLEIASILAVSWFLLVSISGSIFAKLTYGEPWLVRVLERDYNHGGKQFYQRIGMRVSRQQHVESMMRGGLARHVLIHVQHLLGGLLCLPAVLNLFEDQSISSSLVGLGILSEIGWETQDLLVMVYKEVFTKENLRPLIFMNVVHHSLAIGLGLPFLLVHRDHPVGHRLVFHLQGAVVVSGLITEYTKTLDAENPEELARMRFLSFVSLLNMIGVRGVSSTYTYVLGVSTLFAERRWGLMCCGIVLGALFLAFNVVICLIPCYKRCVKFATRRSSPKTTTTKEVRACSDEEVSCKHSRETAVRQR